MSTYREQQIEQVNDRYNRVRDLRTILSLGEEYSLINPAMHYDDDGLHEKISEEISMTCQAIFDELDDMGFFPITDKDVAHE